MSLATFSFQGGRRIRNVINATAGNVVTNLTPTAGKRWFVLFGNLTLVTNGTAGNRIVTLQATDGTVITLDIGQNATAIIANLTRIVSFAYWGSRDASHAMVTLEGVNAMITIPTNLILDGVDELRITIQGGLAGDSYFGYVVVLEMDI